MKEWSEMGEKTSITSPSITGKWLLLPWYCWNSSLSKSLSERVLLFNAAASLFLGFSFLSLSALTYLAVAEWPRCGMWLFRCKWRNFGGFSTGEEKIRESFTTAASANPMFCYNCCIYLVQPQSCLHHIFQISIPRNTNTHPDDPKIEQELLS